MSARRSETSIVVEAASRGDRQAAERLLPLVYDDLRRLARQRLAGEAPGHTLQATALVHEAWLRVVGEMDPGWEGRAHFFESAARAMRRILVDQARRKKADKRQGDRARIEFEDVQDGGDFALVPPNEHVLDIDAALAELEQHDQRKARIVQLRYFGGLSNAEVARVLGISVGTVERDWRFIRARLRKRLEG